MGDLISRKEAISKIQKEYMDTDYGYDRGKVNVNVGLTKALHVLQDMPSAQPGVGVDLFPAVSEEYKRGYRDGLRDKPEPHWIPCSERLPEDIRPVIVTWKNTDPASYYQYIVGKHFTGTACYKNGKWYWYSSTTEDMLAEYGRYDSEEFDEAIECTAWMPLPEPYAERRTDESIHSK